MENFINDLDFSFNDVTSTNNQLNWGNTQRINEIPKQINIEQRTKNIISENHNVIRVKRQILYIKK